MVDHSWLFEEPDENIDCSPSPGIHNKLSGAKVVDEHYNGDIELRYHKIMDGEYANGDKIVSFEIGPNQTINVLCPKRAIEIAINGYIRMPYDFALEKGIVWLDE